MNQIQQIQRINQQELESGTSASWHDQYKDSAYINVGGLPFNLTEGDVIAIFSQYGEILDINLPRDKSTGKPRGFAWIMYSDQRSTILAVDNLNGATILGRMIRVDHTLNYKQLEHDQETGKMKERESESFAADPRNFLKKDAEDGSDAESEISLPPNFDPEDPMAEYILSQHKKRRIEGSGSSLKEKEEKRRRKEERRLKREERERKKLGTSASGSGSRRRDDRDRERESRGRYEDDRDDTRGKRRESPRRRSRSPPPRDDRRRRDDYDDRDRIRDDRYSRDRDDRRRVDGRDERDRGERKSSTRDDERRDSRGPSGSGRGSAFADLEKWARR
ncbi:uncharacterized protein JCM6883_004596 [Sporobolomyces salmoneus]|uniref:uncharacterized protein n=1 Tax=Sporobolomyces salmoneus TaxID=183962 RepID=UPI00316CB0FF